MSPIGRCLGVLSSGDQKKIIAVTLIQICMGALDLLGVVAIGLLGALSVCGLQSHSPGDRISAALRLLNISHLNFQSQDDYLYKVYRALCPDVNPPNAQSEKNLLRQETIPARMI